jgi:hypothetical protein
MNSGCDKMVSFEEAGAILDDAADELPKEIFRELNGGISLLPVCKKNPVDPDGNLYILGEYQVNNLGRTIVLFYGSFEAVYGNMPKEEMKIRLASTLKHEFTHHLESLAGERDLEIEDKRWLNSYFSKKGRGGA